MKAFTTNLRPIMTKFLASSIRSTVSSPELELSADLGDTLLDPVSGTRWLR